MKYEDIDDVAKMYIRAIDNDRVYINNKLYPFYGRSLNIPENQLGNTVCKIKGIEKETGLPMEELAVKIREYVGDISFFREVEGKMVPIESDRLLNAFKAIRDKLSANTVKYLIYK